MLIVNTDKAIHTVIAVEHIRQIVVVLVVHIVCACRRPCIAQIAEARIVRFTSFSVHLPIRDDTMPVRGVEVSALRCSKRIVVIALDMVMREIKCMILVKVIVDANIGSLILIARIQPAIGIPAQTVLVFRIPAHLTAERNKILETICIESTGIGKLIIMTVPRPRRYIERSLRLSFALARDDIDNTARRIRTIDGCARSLDDLDLLDTVHIDDLVDVEHRLRPVCRVIIEYIGS